MEYTVNINQSYNKITDGPLEPHQQAEVYFRVLTRDGHGGGETFFCTIVPYKKMVLKKYE